MLNQYKYTNYGTWYINLLSGSCSQHQVMQVLNEFTDSVSGYYW